MENPVKWWRKHSQEVERIEMYKTQEYARGCDETAGKFKKQVDSLTSKIEELIQQNIESEKRIRGLADSRISHIEHTNELKCRACRVNLEDERQRLRRRQGLLAEKISKFDEVWMNLYQHANTIVEEHDSILRASGRIVASRNILLDFRKQVDIIMTESAPLLSVEMGDSKEDKQIDNTGYPEAGVTNVKRTSKKEKG
jgi:hypothetical protein